MNKANDKDFEINNKVVTVALNKFSKVEITSLLNASTDNKDRQKKAQVLIDYLCGKFNMPKSNVNVLEKNQKHTLTTRGTLKSVTFGDYNTMSKEIRVWNLTAAKGQTVSINQFLNTLLHEFVHHYDMTYLKYRQSPHTSGFYKRLGDISAKLK